MVVTPAESRRRALGKWPGRGLSTRPVFVTSTNVLAECGRAAGAEVGRCGAVHGDGRVNVA